MVIVLVVSVLMVLMSSMMVIRYDDYQKRLLTLLLSFLSL